LINAEKKCIQKQVKWSFIEALTRAATTPLVVGTLVAAS
jgi:hypothetical protein